MGSLTIDRVWDGAEYPIALTYNGTTTLLGFPRASWLRPWEVLCQDLTAQIEAATGQGAVCTTSAAGVIRIVSDVVIDLSFSVGFAAYAGFSSATYEGVAVEATSPKFRMISQLFGCGLPVRWWQRGVEGTIPVVWSDGTDFSFECVWTVTRAAPTFDIRRVPFVAFRPGTLTPYSLSNLSGYLALRPENVESRRDPLGQGSATWGQYPLRCYWLAQSIEV